MKFHSLPGLDLINFFTTIIIIIIMLAITPVFATDYTAAPTITTTITTTIITIIISTDFTFD
jgi:hypothetical protein